jgi:hypothetical protein
VPFGRLVRIAGACQLVGFALAYLLAGWLLGGFEPTSKCSAVAPCRHHCFFYLHDERAILSTLRRAGKSCNVEIALIKANSSYLSMMLRQGLSKKPPCYASDVAQVKAKCRIQPNQ